MSVPTARRCYLHVQIPGWQGRVEDHFIVELRDVLTHATVVALDPVVAVAALTHFVVGGQITAAFMSPMLPAALPDAPPRKALASAPSRAALRAAGVPLRPVQEARRASRRANSAHKKRA